MSRAAAVAAHRRASGRWRASTTLALLLLAPGVAEAQLPPTPTPTPAPSPAPPPPPAAGALTVSLDGAVRDGRRQVVLAGDSWRVRGRMTPGVAGQRVIVRLYRGGRRIAARRVDVRPAPGGGHGTFTVRFRATRPGRLSVRAVHRATPELGTLRARPVRLRVLRAKATPGSRGPVVRLLQAGLDRLRYAVPRSGVYDDGTARAVMAYRKVNGMARTGVASARVVRRVLHGRGAFRPRHPRAGRHVEADISRQVLALVDGARVVRTYHTSTGTSATPTVLGSFRVYLKTPGTNAKSMVDSLYFIRGYAIHGYPSVPPFPASHGCMRVPIPNARAIFDWLRIGDRVIVYP